MHGSKLMTMIIVLTGDLRGSCYTRGREVHKYHWQLSTIWMLVSSRTEQHGVKKNTLKRAFNPYAADGEFSQCKMLQKKPLKNDCNPGTWLLP